MTKIGLNLAAVLLSGFAAGAAVAADVPFGKGFGGWTFTQTAERDGIINCRAHKKTGDQHYIIAYRTNQDNAGYFSMSAKGIKKGKYPSQMTFSGGVIIDVTAVVDDGIRIWAALGDPDLEKVAQEGGFVFHIGRLGATEVDLGARTGDAYNRVIECVNSNR
ncbi:MAG TPA: hypothetical protein DCL54_14820 [Alphaproteobacteria bacterium]|nr:hypothetical protein [Alphaproteobacteria bacterium]HAJ47844.1 hypothetical protein [Alphaproteobacteria bacterium]